MTTRLSREDRLVGGSGVNDISDSPRAHIEAIRREKFGLLPDGRSPYRFTALSQWV
jgi:hypothetical protein